MAVSAHGSDRVRPAANRRLAEEFLDRGGCMVSEYPVGAKPVRRAFAYRDGPPARLVNSLEICPFLLRNMSDSFLIDRREHSWGTRSAVTGFEVLIWLVNVRRHADPDYVTSNGSEPLGRISVQT